MKFPVVGMMLALAGRQTLAGPVLQRRCTGQWKVGQGEGKDCRWVDRRSDFTLAAVPHRLAVDASTRIAFVRREVRSRLHRPGEHLCAQRPCHQCGLLFIVLTFVAVGLVEVLRRLRVHPIQYALIGSALALFLLLPVSLGKPVDFGVAYTIAATACTLLLGYYGAHALQGWRAGLAFAGGIGGLYGLLYLLLLSEPSLLVLGSVLLFAVLAAVMLVTRRIDSYALGARWRSEAENATKPLRP